MCELNRIAQWLHVKSVRFYELNLWVSRSTHGSSVHNATLNTRGWTESVVVDMMAAGFPSDRWNPTIDNYYPASDSDIEDMEDPIEGMRPPANMSVAAKGGAGAPVKKGVMAHLEDVPVGPLSLVISK